MDFKEINPFDQKLIHTRIKRLTNKVHSEIVKDQRKEAKSSIKIRLTDEIVILFSDKKGRSQLIENYVKLCSCAVKKTTDLEVS